MSQKTIIAIIILIIAAGAAGFYVYKNIFQPGQPEGERGSGEFPFGEAPPGEGGTSGEEKTGAKDEEIPQPPTGKISLYKGFWMPCGFYYDYPCQSMADPKDLKDAGANTASIAPNVKINSRGEAKFEAPMDYIEQALAYWAKKYYENNIRISLVIEVTYQKEFTSGGGGEPQPIPRDIASQPGFLTEYNKIVANVAKLAEKYKVEIFSPMNEPDLKLGESVASQWGQQILPVVKQYYNGKILWKAAGSALDKYDTNFKGYDIIGFDPSPGGGPFEQSMATYKTVLENLINTAQNRAVRDGVSEVMIAEFGTWGGAISFTEQQKVLAHRTVFELGQGKVSGFFALDPPPDLDRGLAGTQTLAEIKSWFAMLGN